MSITANGGRGGNGGAGTLNADSQFRGGDGGGGGGGGAGGYIVLQGSTVTLTGANLSASGGQGGTGGAGGAGTPAGRNGSNGGGGGGGRIAVTAASAPQGISASNGANAAAQQGGAPTISVTVQPACTPAVTSIQVNSQVTNTIIAGTNGSVSIYGSCLGNATSVQSDGSGVQFTSISYTSDGRVDAFFQAGSSASGGIHNMTVTTVNGTSGASSSSQAFVTRVTLQSFSFTNSVPYSRDCIGAASPISTPTWPAPSATCPQLGFAGDHAVYASGQRMEGTAVFSVSPIPPMSVTGIYIQGTTAGSGMFTPTGSVTLSGGAATFSAPVSSDTVFPATFTQFINPLGINWSIAQAGGSCASGCVIVGTSSNPVYATLGSSVLPAWAGPIMLTYVKLAVGSGGAFNQASALANTWAQFSTGSGPANVVTWDGRSMRYYSAGFNACALTAQQVVMNVYVIGTSVFYSESAQCGAFALLLESALAVNGIHSNWITINANYQPGGTSNWVKMLIKNWCFIGTAGCPPGSPSYPSEPDYKYGLNLNLDDWMFPPRAEYGDLTNLTGIPGQGGIASTSPPFTPVEKVFDSHFVVQVPFVDGTPLAGNQFFDPSYGATYSSAAGFESLAVAGYVYRFPIIDVPGRYHVSAPIAGTPNIAFTPFPSRSM